MPSTRHLTIPDEMRSLEGGWTVVHVNTSDIDLRSPDAASAARVNDALYDAMKRVCSDLVYGQTLVKVHIGEPKCTTRMNPRFVQGSVQFLLNRGAETVVCGDSTVAYSGPRGHRENPYGNAASYLDLAQQHGWSAVGPAGVPFVVIDRPQTAPPGVYTFDNPEALSAINGVGRFSDFHLAGGFAAADFVVNHAHLTLHGLAGLAGCVKSIAMGCSSLTGKLRMHQSFLPHFDTEKCGLCGRCVDACPEGALKLKDGDACPIVDAHLCIGCGACVAVCAVQQDAVKLRGESISDWERGQDTLPVRMADYTTGLMNDKWERTIHVLHMANITELCDCLDSRQPLMLDQDLGFLVGRNPFAVDTTGAQMLAKALKLGNRTAAQPFENTIRDMAEHIENSYEIVSQTSIEEMII